MQGRIIDTIAQWIQTVWIIRGWIVNRGRHGQAAVLPADKLNMELFCRVRNIVAKNYEFVRRAVIDVGATEGQGLVVF